MIVCPGSAPFAGNQGRRQRVVAGVGQHPACRAKSQQVANLARCFQRTLMGLFPCTTFRTAVSANAMLLLTKGLTGRAALSPVDHHEPVAVTAAAVTPSIRTRLLMERCAIPTYHLIRVREASFCSSRSQVS